MTRECAATREFTDTWDYVVEKIPAEIKNNCNSRADRNRCIYARCQDLTKQFQPCR